MTLSSHSNGNYLEAGAAGPAEGGACALGTTTAGVGAGAAAFGADGGAMIVAAGSCFSIFCAASMWGVSSSFAFEFALEGSTRCTQPKRLRP